MCRSKFLPLSFHLCLSTFVGEAAQPANLDKGPEIDKGSRLRQRPVSCFVSIFVADLCRSFLCRSTFVGEATQPATSTKVRKSTKVPDFDKDRLRVLFPSLSLTFVSPPLSARRRTSKPRQRSGNRQRFQTSTKTGCLFCFHLCLLPLSRTFVVLSFVVLSFVAPPLSARRRNQQTSIKVRKSTKVPDFDKDRLLVLFPSLSRTFVAPSLSLHLCRRGGAPATSTKVFPTYGRKRKNLFYLVSH